MFKCIYVHRDIYTHLTHTYAPYISQRIVLKTKSKRYPKLIDKTTNASTTKKHLLLLSVMVREGFLERSLGPEVNFEGKVQFGLAEESWPGEINGKDQTVFDLLFYRKK